MSNNMADLMQLNSIEVIQKDTPDSPTECSDDGNLTTLGRIGGLGVGATGVMDLTDLGQELDQDEFDGPHMLNGERPAIIAPPESEWYHGRLDRYSAELRLRGSSKLGSYLALKGDLQNYNVLYTEVYKLVYGSSSSITKEKENNKISIFTDIIAAQLL
ncbi:ras GTPase-activating protein 1 isoform X5 [Drosophila bipectinata]|uniref:ras GTPase-activating protein 1 isoform X5 n=1 Tax=Drosophila bipectinata TaxID=42026 RepID=UPI0038B2D9F5